MGREELYTQLRFFVQSILADRYIHRRELRVVSIKSPSSVEYGIRKKIQFSSFTGSYRGLFWHYFANRFQNKLKIFNGKVLLLPIEIEDHC